MWGRKFWIPECSSPSAGQTEALGLVAVAVDRRAPSAHSIEDRTRFVSRHRPAGQGQDSNMSRQCPIGQSRDTRDMSRPGQRGTCLSGRRTDSETCPSAGRTTTGLSGHVRFDRAEVRAAKLSSVLAPQLARPPPPVIGQRASHATARPRRAKSHRMSDCTVFSRAHTSVDKSRTRVYSHAVSGGFAQAAARLNADAANKAEWRTALAPLISRRG
jgi:hypothetical protein